jgi:hypothetical protein
LFQPAGFLLKQTLDVAHLLPCVQRDFHFAFTHGTITFSGESIPRDARQRHKSLRSVFDRILGEPLSSSNGTLRHERSNCRFGMRLSRKLFLKLSTHAIVYSQSRVHNEDIPTSVKSSLQRDVATGVGVPGAAMLTVGPNKNPGIAAGVLHFLRDA